jgi:hypothetical protein
MALICFRASGKKGLDFDFSFALRTSVWHSLRIGLVARCKEEKRTRDRDKLEMDGMVSPLFFAKCSHTSSRISRDTQDRMRKKQSRPSPPVRLRHRVRSHFSFLFFASCPIGMIFSLIAMFYSYVVFGMRYSFFIIIFLLYSLSSQ